MQHYNTGERKFRITSVSLEPVLAIVRSTDLVSLQRLGVRPTLENATSFHRRHLSGLGTSYLLPRTPQPGIAHSTVIGAHIWIIKSLLGPRRSSTLGEGEVLRLCK